jgi:hypothetical protein
LLTFFSIQVNEKLFFYNRKVLLVLSKLVQLDDKENQGFKAIKAWLVELIIVKGFIVGCIDWLEFSIALLVYCYQVEFKGTTSQPKEYEPVHVKTTNVVHHFLKIEITLICIDMT